ncbi:hypothetical protein QR680_018193 [Steinernema hermaphroditum]|uniref:Clusterin-associated protein 1 n=1 Tax=Steinernema hermaphroditum TaxID=289476 RepID=A0AA39LQQ0_9BILA|nr:hypothetical protein QR680_018193 [Steinernema hermaphroditum]
MSYREVRNVTEMLRALAYPRLVSIENFRTPNFKLVAEILEWVAHRFDPTARLNFNLENQGERVLFVKTVVLLLLQRARVKLNPRKLYQADGYAAQELHVVLKILYDATLEKPAEENSSEWTIMKSKINAKRQEISRIRQLASQIPQSGAALFDLLNKEVVAKDKRSRALTNSLNLSDVESNIRSLVTSAVDSFKAVEDKLANINNDEQALDTKIERRKKEYEQLEKRLAKLQSFRPQYMDDYEKYEQTLKGLYELYVIKFRNLTYMEQLAQEVERAEKEKTAELEQTMRQTVEKMRSEVAKSPPIESLQIEDMNKNEVKRPMVFGNMTGAGLSDDDEDDDDEEDELVNFDENLDLEEEFLHDRRGSLQRSENVAEDGDNDEDDF